MTHELTYLQGHAQGQSYDLLSKTDTGHLNV